jgi:hypothetical protein
MEDLVAKAILISSSSSNGHGPGCGFSGLDIMHPRGTSVGPRRGPAGEIFPSDYQRPRNARTRTRAGDLILLVRGLDAEDWKLQTALG